MPTGTASKMLIDGLQYCRWSRPVFEQMRAAKMSAVHVTLSYHGGFRDAIRALTDWNSLKDSHGDLILIARSMQDIALARKTDRTAILFGLQNPMAIEDDLGLVEILHTLGVRLMQLTYNNQSLLGCGWMEAEDTGITRMGREVIAEMNRLGMIVDLSHAGEKTILSAIECSKRPVAVTHANPAWWRQTGRNLSKAALLALGQNGGMIGLSLYPHHMSEGSDTSLESFCTMARDVAALVGVGHVGIGSDLCQDQPDEVVQWMRTGRWSKPSTSLSNATFPPQPAWFRDNRDFPRLAEGLEAAGFPPSDAELILGGNWARFLTTALEPMYAQNERNSNTSFSFTPRGTLP